MRTLIEPRAFEISNIALSDMWSGRESLTSIMNRHAGSLGDYDDLLAWQNVLQRDSNWTGNKIPFESVATYYLAELEGDQRYTQRIFDNYGEPAGFLRLRHMARDTKTTPADCSRIQETLVCDVSHLRDLTLFRAMYDYAVDEAARVGHARVIREIDVGLSAKRYLTLAHDMADLSSRADLLDDVQAKLGHASHQFHKDWVKATSDFVGAMGCHIIDVMVPQNSESATPPQIRISRNVPYTSPAPLPPFQSKGKDCYRYDPKIGLQPIEEAVAIYKANALKHYPSARL